MAMSSEDIGLTILAAAEVPNFLAGLLPSKMTISRFAVDEHDLRMIRRGEVMGSALALTVGLAASMIADNPAPLIACIVVLLILLYEYEHSIRNPNPRAEPMEGSA
jgi:hypothetical protein